MIKLPNKNNNVVSSKQALRGPQDLQGKASGVLTGLFYQESWIYEETSEDGEVKLLRQVVMSGRHRVEGISGVRSESHFLVLEMELDSEENFRNFTTASLYRSRVHDQLREAFSDDWDKETLPYRLEQVCVMEWDQKSSTNEDGSLKKGMWFRHINGADDKRRTGITNGPLYSANIYTEYNANKTTDTRVNIHQVHELIEENPERGIPMGNLLITVDTLTKVIEDGKARAQQGSRERSVLNQSSPSGKKPQKSRPKPPGFEAPDNFGAPEEGSEHIPF